MARIKIITGHYGSGKTEYAVNLALHLAKTEEKTTLADLDIVNPYFRSYEQAQRLEDAGIRVIVTSCGGVADIPAINPAVLSVFQNADVTGVLDVGGDPIGARVLARFAPYLAKTDFELLFILNANRPETKDIDGAESYMRAIEAQCLQRVTGIVNNTHLCGETTLEDILKGAKLAKELSDRTGLPIVHHAVTKSLAPQAAELLDETVLPLQLYMKKPWEVNFCEEDSSLWQES